METPVEQSIVPSLQELVGSTHGAPGVQATQLPPKHMLPPPQAVPFTAVVRFWQTGAPVLQLVVPCRQGFAGSVQGAPGLQLMQAPLKQLWPAAPHALPFAALPTLAQVEVPVAQEVVPLRQELVGAAGSGQTVPATQPTHCPALQTWSGPHAVPLAVFVRLEQVEVPPGQVVEPVWQPPLAVQAWPGVQIEPQLPPLQEPELGQSTWALQQEAESRVAT